MRNFRKFALALILIVTFSTNPGFASVVHTQSISRENIIIMRSVPVEVSVSTNKTTYLPNEVVHSTIDIMGGMLNPSSTPTYRVTYSDSTGFSYTWTTQQTTIPFTKSYSSGYYSITVRVTSNQSQNEAYDTTHITVQ